MRTSFACWLAVAFTVVTLVGAASDICSINGVCYKSNSLRTCQRGTDTSCPPCLFQSSSGKLECYEVDNLTSQCPPDTTYCPISGPVPTTTTSPTTTPVSDTGSPTTVSPTTITNAPTTSPTTTEQPTPTATRGPTPPTTGGPTPTLSNTTDTASQSGGGQSNSVNGTTQPGTTNLSPPSSSASPLAIALIVVSTVFALVIAIIGYRVCVKRRHPATHDAYDKAGTPGGTWNSAPINIDGSISTGHSSQEYLDNDVRNDKALLPFRIEQRDIQLNEIMATGGFGVVYKATFKGQTVAVKQLQADGWRNEALLSSFMDEIRMCSKLEHSKIVEFIGITWSSLRDISVVAEFMSGGDLHALLMKQRSTAPEDWFKTWTSSNIKCKTSLATDVTEAVVYLHSFDSPILHRDLKARNVLLDDSGNAKLSDFGISRELSADETMTSEVGTSAWIAPEVLRGERYSEKADIYSLGVLLVELDRCCHPYDDEPLIGRDNPSLVRGPGRFENGVSQSVSSGTHSDTQIAVMVSTGQLSPSVSRDCPRQVGELVARCLQFEPAQRPSAMEVFFELRQLRKIVKPE